MTNWSKPDVLYRTSCSCCSQAPTVQGRDIVARSDADIFLYARYNNKLDELREAFVSHMDWYSDEASPFISADDDVEAARREARRRVDNDHEGVTVATIDTQFLEGLKVRHVEAVRAQFGIWLEPDVYARARTEFLILHRIPSKAVVQIEYFDE